MLAPITVENNCPFGYSPFLIDADLAISELRPVLRRSHYLPRLKDLSTRLLRTIQRLQTDLILRFYLYRLRHMELSSCT